MAECIPCDKAKGVRREDKPRGSLADTIALRAPTPAPAATEGARCDGCDCALPMCGGEADPTLCRPGLVHERRKRSIALSSIHHGWPAKFRRVEASKAPTRPHPDAFLAPLRDPATGATLPADKEPWEGLAARRPRDYEVAVTIVHVDAPDLLAANLASWRAQTVRPYFIVVDSGSHGPARAELERMEAESDDLELVLMRPRGFVATSQPVAVAMDHAFAACQSPYLFATHLDVFPLRPDLIEWLLGLCKRPGTPAAGWQMSPRPASRNDWWTRTLSHTATVYDMAAMRRLGAHWSMLSAFERLGIPAAQPHNTGFPDTETNLGMILNDRGVDVRWLGDPDPGPDDPPSVLMVGTEANEPYTGQALDGTEWLIHQRSTTCHRMYDPPLAARRREDLYREAAEAVERAKGWEADRAGR